MNTPLLARIGKLLRHPVVLCLSSFFVCLFLGLLLFLPLKPFARHIEQLAQSEVPGLTLQIVEPQLLLSVGLGANEISIQHAQLPHPPFKLRDLALRPLWLSLLSSNPGISFDLDIFQGQVSGTAHKDGTVQTTLNNLQIEEPLGPQLPLTLVGLVKNGEFSGKLPLAGKNQSKLQLELDDLRLTGMQKFGTSNDSLQLGRLNCTAEARGPLIQISNLTATGPAFELKGNGSLRVGRTAANSSLNLSLILTPKAGLDPMLNDLLSLTKKPQADGSYHFSLRGALAGLRFN